MLAFGMFTFSFEGVAVPLRPQATLGRITYVLEEPPVESPWTLGANYSVATDLADSSDSRLYFQNLGASIGFQINQRWAVSGGLTGSFTTLDGQIEKRQEETVLESTGFSPSFGLMYSPNLESPWMVSGNGSLLLDSASQREGYLGVAGASVSHNSSFWEERIGVTNALSVTELINRFEKNSSGTFNPGTSITYSLGTNLKMTDNLGISASFGLKRTRYLDGFWDYSYGSTVAISLNGENWSASLATSQGGYTEDGTVSLWYLNEYRRIVSVSFGYRF